MDPRHCQVERNAHFTRGPRFFRDGGGLMFEFIIDASNVVGPRPATEGDKRNHPEAWDAFAAEYPLVPSSDEAPLDRKSVEIAGATAEYRRYAAHEELVLEPAIEREHHEGQPAKRAYRRKSLPDEAA